MTPPLLQPATKLARTVSEDGCDWFDEKKMDQQIQEHFIGRF